MRIPQTARTDDESEGKHQNLKTTEDRANLHHAISLTHPGIPSVIAKASIRQSDFRIVLEPIDRPIVLVQLSCVNCPRDSSVYLPDGHWELDQRQNIPLDRGEVRSLHDWTVDVIGFNPDQ